MRYLIIGLGIYGTNLAIDLTKMGNEVIGADVNHSLVDAIKDYISTAYILDATDESALTALPLNNVDLVIVAIGENFGASIRIVALLKKLKVPHIYARAIDDLHESILESFEIDRILTPEQRAATDLVNEMGVGGNVWSLKIDDNNFIMKFKAPDKFTGEPYSSLNLDKDYNLKLLGATRLKASRNALGIMRKRQELMDSLDNERVEADDILICQGTAEAYRDMYRHLSV